MRTVILYRNGDRIIVNCESQKEKQLRKEGWSSKNAQKPKDEIQGSGLSAQKPANTKPNGASESGDDAAS